jgi:hypothetical protein
MRQAPVRGRCFAFATINSHAVFEEWDDSASIWAGLPPIVTECSTHRDGLASGALPLCMNRRQLLVVHWQKKYPLTWRTRLGQA